MNSKINNETNNETKDLCKTCTHYWQDFPLPLDHIESHCEILDEKKGLSANMDKEIPYPCLKCPFNCYISKKKYINDFLQHSHMN